MNYSVRYQFRYVCYLNYINGTLFFNKCKVVDTIWISFSGTKKQGSTQGQYDIAFLNADCYSEIIWVKRAAFLLEDTFGITCAIPGEDYLFGLPIDDLDFYYNQFKTVIVTLTRNSRIDQRYTIKSSVSSIVVELDYKRKIPPHLTNMPHINGSYCEHVWFSQLTEEIGKRHPGKYICVTVKVRIQNTLNSN